MSINEVRAVANFTFRLMSMAQAGHEDQRAWGAIVGELVKAAKALDALSCAQCNYGLTQAQETRRHNILRHVAEVTDKMGLVGFNQTDPRGMSLYILPGNTLHVEAKANYMTIGIAVPY